VKRRRSRKQNAFASSTGTFSLSINVIVDCTIHGTEMKDPNTNTNITATEYREFQDAFNWFNVHLFDGSLPEALVTLQRKARARGYFSENRFTNRQNSNERIHEIAPNPDHFTNRTDTEILSTLVHEMCHLWRRVFGKPGRSGYHDRQWRMKMKEVGLHPSSTAAPGGKETGYKVSHFIREGGRFEVECVRFLNSDHRLNWEARTYTPKQKAKPKFQP
jgi:hypothetical protein